ncbi:unnamed protein product [Merluccius merluccius]
MTIMISAQQLLTLTGRAGDVIKAAMSSRGVCEACCVCGGPLQGNQRRWLFGGQNRRGGGCRTPTPAESQRGGRSASSQSSPCGSTWSLGSSASLSRYQQALSSPTKGLDLLSVLSHILGRTVPRGGSRGEFLCGKCVAVLERVFKFDSVIARVKVLSSERLQKLREQRDRMGSWVRYAYDRGPPGEGERPGEDEGCGYREMLQDNMSLSEYECWSERWDACPHFIRTGKRCGRGPGCEGCDSLRVSDSDYESVCGVPRHLPAHVASPLALSRNKYHSMPLHWSSQASLGGSSLSSRPTSRTQSVQSLDSLDGGADPFDWPEGSVDLLLKELKNIEGKPVCSPTGSRIPLLNRKEGRFSNQKRAMVETDRVNRELSFEKNGQNGENGENGEKEEKEEKEERYVPLDLTDDFLPLHLQVRPARHGVSACQLQQALGQLGGRLDEVLIGTQEDSEPPQNPGINISEQQFNNVNMGMFSSEDILYERYRFSSEGILYERYRFSSEGIRYLIVLVGPYVGNATKRSLTCSVQAWLAALRSDWLAGGRMEREMEEMRRVGREREGDLHILSTVLQHNQDLINDLRLSLREKDQVQEELEKEREVWRSREETLTAILQEKEALLLSQKEVLESSHKEVLALSDSVIGQGMLGDGTGAALANQLREKEVLLAVCLKDREESSATMWKEVNKMTAALQEYSIHKVTQHNTTQLDSREKEQRQEERQGEEEQRREESRKLRGMERELKEVQCSLEREKEEREREERRLNDALEMRDRLIEKILWDSAERDRLFRDVQQNLLNTSGSARASTLRTGSLLLPLCVTDIPPEEGESGDMMSVPLGSVTIGPQAWRESTERSVRRAERLVRQTRAAQSGRTTRTPKHTETTETKTTGDHGTDTDRKDNRGVHCITSRPQTTGTTFPRDSKSTTSAPFPPASLRERCARQSMAVATDYTRWVREVELRLRRQTGRASRERAKLERERAHLEMMLRSLRSDLQQQQDGADWLLAWERRELAELKRDIEETLRETQHQLQVLDGSSRDLQVWSSQQALVLDLLPHRGSLPAPRPRSASINTTRTPPPTYGFTSESEQVLDSSSLAIDQSQRLREQIRRILSEVVAKQRASQHVVNGGLVKKVAETVTLERSLALTAATTRHAAFRKQREVDSIRLSYGRAQGPESSGDRFSRERLGRPVVQVFQRHPGTQLPEATHLLQGSAVLKYCLSASEDDAARLRRCFLQLRGEAQ